MMNIQHNVDLKPFNTFGLPARARHFIELTSAADLPDLCTLPCFQHETVLWLGGGSNILLMQDYEGLVVKMANKGIREIKRENETVYIEAQAGEIWHDFVLHTINAGLSGLENLSLIPGTVGASPIQNIGAYGVEVKDVIHAVHCFDLTTNQFIELSNAECRFDYRESIFKQQGKGRYVILSVVFALKSIFKPNIHYGDLAAVLQKLCGKQQATAKDVSDAVCQIRSQKLPDPKILGNVGSFFKNPVIPSELAAKLTKKYPSMPHYPQPNGTTKLAAGWLIDQCGLKGYRIGDAAVHEKQALVLINLGHATAKNVAELSHHIQQTVLNRFGILLQPEPNWL
ncbi:MAG: UDP-N-acetylmuramate dehydrogenase [Neisseria sp.]|uniref:UDP-N-acetylmuramate dehydrogenase n=1 Tax=Neisseria sp. TaxID=192066 RepID=UPI0026DD1FEA|nr:UDP-N-acetylmuramate dehydrogenase [Neisseria sp.]MDO4640459.1 UDP-N-acetylmuramate dehydrogenase [Neisseria sp.]